LKQIRKISIAGVEVMPAYLAYFVRARMHGSFFFYYNMFFTPVFFFEKHKSDDVSHAKTNDTSSDFA
jgi:hypothetical protein